MKKSKIKSIKCLGKRKTYNLTMKSEQHNYAIYDRQSEKSVISMNSHSAAYSLIGYYMCYLKANYTDEFSAVILILTTREKIHDKMEIVINDLYNFDIGLSNRKLMIVVLIIK